jgi:hypothetical protein
LGIDPVGNVVLLPNSQTNSFVARGEIVGANVNSTQTIASLAPAGYPYLKSVSVSMFNSIGKASIAGVMLRQNSILACSGIGGGTNTCVVNTAVSGTLTLSTGNAPGFQIILSNVAGTFPNLYYTAEYSKF